MRKTIMFLSLLAILALIWLGFFSSLSSKLGKETLQPPPRKQNAKVLTRLINEWRVKKGLSAYLEDQRLCEIAEDRSNDSFDHQGFYDKYYHGNSPYIMQENLSIVRTNEGEVLKGWLDSPPHRATLEKPYTHSCIACDKQCVQIFSSFTR